jgi:hypothetical protein
VRHIGAYDDSLSWPLYGFYTVLMPRYLDLLRARHRRRTVLKHEWHEGGILDIRDLMLEVGRDGTTFVKCAHSRCS